MRPAGATVAVGGHRILSGAMATGAESAHTALATTTAEETAELPRLEASPGDNTSGQSLAQRTRRGLAFSAASRFASQGLQLSVSIVLARLIAPAEYGLIAIVLTFTGFAALFTDLGIGAAIIHKRDLNGADKDTAFWINALSGLGLTLLFICLAVPIAHFYDQPTLTGLVVLASVDFSISLYIVPSALLQRELRFNLMAKVEVSAAILNAAVSVACAFAGMGAYAIVCGLLAQTFLLTIMMNRTARYRPGGFIDRGALRTLCAYSGSLFGFNVLNYWARNLDNLLIGRFNGPAELAFYSRAYNLMMVPTQQVTGVLGRVLFPAFATLQNDLVRLRNAYSRSLHTLLAVVTPLSIVLATAANPLIVLVYGRRWESIAPLLTILAASGPAQIVSGTTGSLYQALGRTNAQLRRGLVNTAIIVVAIAVGLHWGARGVAVALLVTIYVSVGNATGGCWPLIGLSWSTFARRIAPTLFCCAIMAGAMVIVGWTASRHGLLLTLLAQLVVGIGSYLLALWIFDRSTLMDTLGHFSRSR